MTDAARIAYQDFDLRVHRANGTYRAVVLASPAGACDVEIDLAPVLQDALIRATLQDLERNPSVFNRARLVDAGTRLFDALFVGNVRRLYDTSLGTLIGDAGLRIRLRLAPDLIQLPWEFICDPLAQRFLALSRRAPLSRCPEAPVLVSSANPPFPLRILVVTASPTDAASLDMAKEKRLLNESLEPLIQRGLVTIKFIPESAGLPMTVPAMQHALRERVDLLHFIGHGAISMTGTDLVFENDDRSAHRVRVDQIASWLVDACVRLVVLNSCWGAGGWTTQNQPALALALTQAGVPALVAARGPLLDETAIKFTRAFYAALADGCPIDASMAEARKELADTADPDDLGWGAHMLYLQSGAGALIARSGATRWTITFGARLERDQGASSIVERLLSRAMPLLREARVSVEITYEPHLGAELEIVAPKATAVLSPPTFQWRLGQRHAQRFIELARARQATIEIPWQVEVWSDDGLVWSSPAQHIAIQGASDMVAEGDAIRQVQFSDQDWARCAQTGGRFQWHLQVELPPLEGSRRVRREEVWTVFRVLTSEESVALETIQTHWQSDEDAALVRGAVYETFALYEAATVEYKRAVELPNSRSDAAIALARLFRKRAWGLVGVAGESPLQNPDPQFVDQANQWSKL